MHCDGLLVVFFYLDISTKQCEGQGLEGEGEADEASRQIGRVPATAQWPHGWGEDVVLRNFLAWPRMS